MDRILEAVASDLVVQIKSGVVPSKWEELLHRIAEGLDVQLPALGGATSPVAPARTPTPTPTPAASDVVAPVRPVPSGGKPKMIPEEAIARGEFTCIGTCGRTLPIKKFPTPNGMTGGKFRLTECRDCRAGREKGRGGDGSPPPWST